MMKDYSDAWKDPSIPETHWKVIEKERKLVEEGRAREVAPYRAIDDCFEDTTRYPSWISILEIGAATGFYERVLRSLISDKYPEFRYTALDYSPAFRDFAAKVHPDIPFIVADATDTGLPTSSYEFVISGCCVLHIPEYKMAMREAVRVAKDYVIWHRTPLVERRPTFSFTKEAYGVECVETWFNRREFYDILSSLGLKVVKEVEVFYQPEADYGHYSIVCEK